MITKFNEAKKVNTLKWIPDGNIIPIQNFIAKSGDFVFILKRGDVGVYGSGKCYYLQVRKLSETKPHYLATFWLKNDGHDGYRDGVDGKLWDDIQEIQDRATEILKNHFYI